MRKRTIRLGDVTDNFDSLRKPVKKTERVAGEFPYYGASGVVDHVDNYIFDGEYLLIAEDGENLRSRSTPIAFMAAGKFWVNNHAHVVRGNHLADTRFLNYLLAITDISGYLTGSAQPKLSRASMDSIQISLPDLDTQRAIAEVLGALDDKIAANNRLVETASQLSNALFKESLADSAATEAKISEVCAVVARGITPKYSEAEDSMIVLNQKCVRQQRISLKQARRTELSKVREEKILLHNDVLVNSTGQGTLGRVARWTSPERVTADSHITILRFDPSLVNPVCGGFAVLRSEKVITAMAEGSTGQTELSRRELGKLALLLPPAEVQDSLGQKLSEITEYSDALTQENQRLSGTRDALLPLLMSGKLRVREAEAVVKDVL